MIVNKLDSNLQGILQILLLVGALFLPGTTVYARDWHYSVRPGDTLWSLGERYLRSVAYVPRLQALNNVADPYKLPPGMRLRVPVSWLRSEPVDAVLKSVIGEIRVIPAGGGQMRLLEAGDPLQSGDILRTGPDTNAVLRFLDGSEFVLRQNSELSLEQINAFTDTGMVDTRMYLQKGRVNGEVPPTSGAATRFQIRTPAAQTAVRGTGYRVSYDDKTTRTEVLSGQVDLTSRGVTRRIRANFGAAALDGQTPQRPRELLPPASLEGIPPVLERLPLQLDWPDLPQAAAYRVQIDTSTDFTDLLVDERSSESQLRVRDLPDGEYYLRIRGIDSVGLEGRDAIRALSINARPEPPFLVGPTADSTVRVAVPELRWTEAENAIHYHLQVASDAAFGQIVFDQPDYASDRWHPQELLPEGEYFWRIATVDSSGEQGPYSDVIRFWLRPTPDPEPPTVGDDVITFRFSEGLPGEQYHFQLARDQQFSDLIEDQKLTEPAVALSKPIGGNTYYMRYSMIGTDGVEGPFSSIQRIYLPIDDYRPITIFTTIVGILLLL